jgi:hypothetical protein
MNLEIKRTRRELLKVPTHNLLQYRSNKISKEILACFSFFQYCLYRIYLDFFSYKEGMLRSQVWAISLQDPISKIPNTKTGLAE